MIKYAAFGNNPLITTSVSAPWHGQGIKASMWSTDSGETDPDGILTDVTYT